VIPPQQNAEFVCAMEQVLETYKKPYDARKPMVCMDETSKQLVKETRQPIAIEAGQPLRYDYEYERHGVANLFMFCEPLRGWRRVSVTEHRTKVDWARQIKRLVDENYPDVQRITLVMDNLNTHRLSSLYEAFPPAEARRLIDKLEVVHTPKHGSWLNIAEIELNVLSRQCLDQRIADQRLLVKQTNAWETDRNAATVKVDWQFTTEDARIKLKRLYPKIQMG
jgi:hypothetical protein